MFKGRLRDAEQIQQAHDLLEAVILGELPTPPGADRLAMMENLNALCWVLEHKNVPTLAANLHALDTWLREHGFVMTTLEHQPAPAFQIEPEE